jgi:hypothetical protein
MPITKNTGLLVAGILSAVVVASHAAGQSYVRADCSRQIVRDRTDPASLTGRWYKRFWTGECGDLNGCLGGSPNWNQVVSSLVARSEPLKRPSVLAKACRLGPLIGLEWTKPRNVRRIDSGDLKAFKSTLDHSGDVLQGLTRVEAQARGKIARGGE